MKIATPATPATPSKGSVQEKTKKLSARKQRADFFPAKVTVEKKPVENNPGFVFQMLDSVKVKRDIPGTDFKKGMQGAIVNLGGNPPTIVEVEVIDPPYTKDIAVDDIELVRRY